MHLEPCRSGLIRTYIPRSSNMPVAIFSIRYNGWLLKESKANLGVIYSICNTVVFLKAENLMHGKSEQKTYVTIFVWKAGFSQLISSFQGITCIICHSSNSSNNSSRSILQPCSFMSCGSMKTKEVQSNIYWNLHPSSRSYLKLYGTMKRNYSLDPLEWPLKLYAKKVQKNKVISLMIL